ncbi:MAG TPA: redoxin family protein [Terriglobales bacterium]|nr:redoxin family protein [Terriglobales bacterium]
MQKKDYFNAKALRAFHSKADCGILSGTSIPQDLTFSVFFKRDLAANSFIPMVYAIVLLVTSTATAQLKAIDLSGNRIDLAQAAHGRTNVLIFVRTDCPISNRYAPTLQKLRARYAEKATFWLVYPDKAESAAAIKRYLHDYNYKQISAVRDPEHALVKLAHAQITPEAAVFNANSRLVYRGRIDNWFQGFGHARPQPTTHDLEDAIQAAIEGKPIAVAETQAIGCFISDLQ